VLGLADQLDPVVTAVLLLLLLSWQGLAWYLHLQSLLLLIAKQLQGCCGVVPACFAFCCWLLALREQQAVCSDQ